MQTNKIERGTHPARYRDAITIRGTARDFWKKPEASLDISRKSEDAIRNL